MAIGIEAINAYATRASVDVAALFEYRGLSPHRFGNLMMDRRSVALPCEDAVSNAVNAARPILDALDPAERDRIQLVVVGTESGVDLGKPLSTYIHHYLGLPARCRSFEVKHACYGGTAALRTATGILCADPVPGGKALVIAAETPSAAARGTYWEPSEGAGAVAMLVGREPEVLDLDPGAYGCHTYEVMDTLRPSPDIDVVDSDLSLLSYLTCLTESFGAYRDRVAGADIIDSFAHLALHVPFPGMVKGAHRMLLRKQRGMTPEQAEQDFRRRVEASVRYGRQVGNLFSGSLYLALCALIDGLESPPPLRIGLFSYGSGCASEFFSGVVGEHARESLRRFDIGGAIAARTPVDPAEYDRLGRLGGDTFGVRDQVFDPEGYGPVYADRFEGAGLLVLDRIENYHRRYRWS